jgi:hypothetical protein
LVRNTTPASTQATVVVNQNVTTKRASNAKNEPDKYWAQPHTSGDLIKRGDLMFGISNPKSKTPTTVTNSMAGIKKTADIFFAGVALTDHLSSSPPELACVVKGLTTVFNHGLCDLAPGDLIAYKPDPCLLDTLAPTQERGRRETIARPMIFPIKQMPLDRHVADMLAVATKIVERTTKGPASMKMPRVRNAGQGASADTKVEEYLESCVSEMRGELLDFFPKCGRDHPLASLAITLLCQCIWIGAFTTQDPDEASTKIMLEKMQKVLADDELTKKYCRNANRSRNKVQAHLQFGSMLSHMVVNIVADYKTWEVSHIFAKCVEKIPRGRYGPVVFV